MRTMLVMLALGAATFGSGDVRAQDPAAANYSIDTSRTTRDVKVGEKGTLSIVIVPASGKRVHDQAPLSVSIKAPKGLAFAKAKLGHSDVANPGDKSPEVKTEFTAREAGSQQADADVQFFICTEKWCERMQARVSVPITVR